MADKIKVLERQTYAKGIFNHGTGKEPEQESRIPSRVQEIRSGAEGG
ncbi:MAG: hypothetical protein ACLSA0_10230 [Eisenbergiella massiliensis]|jgi:hypothetical protein